MGAVKSYRRCNRNGRCGRVGIGIGCGGIEEANNLKRRWTDRILERQSVQSYVREKDGALKVLLLWTPLLLTGSASRTEACTPRSDSGGNDINAPAGTKVSYARSLIYNHCTNHMSFYADFGCGAELLRSLE